MKLPRGVSGERLIRALASLGYQLIRQKGSHARMRNTEPPAHTLTIPLHDSLKTGTLHGILTEVAQMRSISIEQITKLL
jgi:predicted RNA binding protein YcfA (HicA-like mRNA interferase family)